MATISPRSTAAAMRAAAAGMSARTPGSGISERTVGSRKANASSTSTPRPASTRASNSGNAWRCTIASERAAARSARRSRQRRPVAERSTPRNGRGDNFAGDRAARVIGYDSRLIWWTIVRVGVRKGNRISCTPWHRSSRIPVAKAVSKSIDRPPGGVQGWKPHQPFAARHCVREGLPGVLGRRTRLLLVEYARERKRRVTADMPHRRNRVAALIEPILILERLRIADEIGRLARLGSQISKSPGIEAAQTIGRLPLNEAQRLD